MPSLSPEDQELLNLPNRRPDLKKRMRSILSISCDEGDGIVRADEAESLVIEEVRRMGNEVLTGWAESRIEKSGADLPADGDIVRSGKKNVRHTTSGVISVFEQEYRRAGKRFRPFSRSAGITCRCCSLPLQRAATDFGADHAFGHVPEKLKEHYGTTLPAGTVRSITKTHARHIYERRRRERIEEYPSVRGLDFVIAETDGGMVPVAVTDEHAEDRRKGKKYTWKEARLSIAHVPGDTTLQFGSEFQEGVDEAEKNLFDCACRAGFGSVTCLHSVGDGASWIYGQVEKQFGSQGRYLVDFYHVCEYLEDAAPSCCGKNEKKTWTARQRELLKDGCTEKVIESLRPHLEPEETEDRNAPVRRCLRYLDNRPGQFDYPGAREQGLPVGSGEIESAHRYIIQERLKIAGAWWTPENARFMLALRVDRADGYREKHWHNMRRAAYS